MAKPLEVWALEDVQNYYYGGDQTFESGWEYWQSGRILQAVRTANGLRSRVQGTYVYSVRIVERAPGVLDCSCSCPYSAHWGGDCKHIIATLLAWGGAPETFRRVSDWQAALEQKSKEELVGMLTDVFEAQPELIQLYGFETEHDEYDPRSVVQSVFDAALSPRGLTDDELFSRLEIIARQADRFDREGDADLARRIYFQLVLGCLAFVEEHHTYELFRGDFPYVFVVRYAALAQQHDDSAQVLQELATLNASESATILGVSEVLATIDRC